jgi:ribosomal protein S18 acetylase RimI-like enzyme
MHLSLRPCHWYSINGNLIFILELDSGSSDFVIAKKIGVYLYLLRQKIDSLQFGRCEMPMNIRPLRNDEKPPLDLLLLADPSPEIVNSYIRRGRCFVAERDRQIIGVYVLIDTRPQTVELVNIAVSGHEQGKGIGKKLVLHAIETARSIGYKKIEIGTGNSSISQLALYQKCGFRITGIDRDYFIIHYQDAIYENGIQCRDMIRLSKNLSEKDKYCEDGKERRGTMPSPGGFALILGRLFQFLIFSPFDDPDLALFQPSEILFRFSDHFFPVRQIPLQVTMLTAPAIHDGQKHVLVDITLVLQAVQHSRQVISPRDHLPEQRLDPFRFLLSGRKTAVHQRFHIVVGISLPVVDLHQFQDKILAQLPFKVRIMLVNSSFKLPDGNSPGHQQGKQQLQFFGCSLCH